MKVRVRSARVIGGMLATAVSLAFALTAVAAAQTPYPQITATPSLYPAFDASVPDYVVRCNDNDPVSISVTAPAGTEVNVDNEGPRTGTFTTSFRLKPGFGFPITVTSGGTGQTHHVRCLPSDLPRSTFQRTGQPQAEWYAVAPANKTNFGSFPPGVSPNYVILFDGNGVPVWWKKVATQPLDFDVLANGELAWAALDNTGIDQLRIDGSLVRHVNAVGAGVALDPHEVLVLPNGNYLVNIARVIPGVTPCGGTPTPIYDTGAQEITPAGTAVWTWWGSDHIANSEVPDAWCEAKSFTGEYDPYHINSAAPDGNGGVIMSFRHLDAVYRVNKADGSVTWKLGGKPRAESLTVVNDPVAATGDTFRGNHDARLLSDGTVTVHDNGFHPTASRPPRAVRYAIDTGTHTATLVEQKNDPGNAPTPLCCGSARKLPGNDWLMSWGSAGIITELNPAGGRVLNLTFDDGLFSYRAHGVPFGRVSRAALQAGMDAQFPRGYTRSKSAGMGQPLKVSLVPAFKECVAPDRVHGPPLASPSCSSPTLTSSMLTVGTNDANGQAANSSGFVSYGVLMGNPSTPANEADVDVNVELSDVRWKADLSDYGGQLQLQGAVRITDRFNGSLQNEAATGQDTEFPVLIQCGVTASPTTGGQCSLDTSLNAVVPGTVVEGERSTWQLGQVQIYDGGPSGFAGGSGAALFATQGVFVP